MAAQTLEQVVSLCKRRGFIFPSSDIYGGLQGTYDYGPLGVELKNNLKRLWWRHNVYRRDDMEGIETALLTNRFVLRYSGHEGGFTDPLIDNKTTKKRYRLDHLLKEQGILLLVEDGRNHFVELSVAMKEVHAPRPTPGEVGARTYGTRVVPALQRDIV